MSYALVLAMQVLSAEAHGAAAVDETTSEVNDPGAVIDLSGVWFFQPGDAQVFATTTFDDRSWVPLRVPTERVSYSRRWQGYGWYRRHLYVDPRVLGNDLMLSLGPAREVVEVYLNGTLLAQRGHFGSRLRGEARVLPLDALIPSGLLKSGENLLALRIYDPSFTCGLPAGPMILGPPDIVRQHGWFNGNGPLAVRISLALAALCIALSQILIAVGRADPLSESRWAAGAGISLAVVQFEGTGILQASLPSLELAVRLPIIFQPLALLCMGSFFASRYDDVGSLRAKIGQSVLVTVTALGLLGPDKLVFIAAGPVMMGCALLTTLYVAHLLALAARRREPGILPTFAAVIANMVLLVYDGMVPALSDVTSSWAAMGAVGTLGLACIVQERVNRAEQQTALIQVARLQKQLDSRAWMDILSAAASAITMPQVFLDAVAQEIARQMQVRRCSIILPNKDGILYIAACQGMPTQACHTAIKKGPSIARYVFDSGTRLTTNHLPAELAPTTDPSRAYVTEGFVAQPIREGSRVHGVVNVSDRNNGDTFSEDDETKLTLFAERLALVLTRLNVRVDDLLAQSAVALERHVIRDGEHAKGKPVELLPAVESAPPKASYRGSIT